MTNGDPANIGANKILDLGTLAEQGEAYDFHYAEGAEPASYEAESFATGAKRVTRKKPKKKMLVRSVPLRRKMAAPVRRKMAAPLRKIAGGSIVQNFRKNQAVRQKNKANETKNNAAAIKAMSKPSAMKLPAIPKAPLKKASAGMSMGMKIGIGVGIAALLGIVAYVVMKKKGKTA